MIDLEALKTRLAEYDPAAPKCPLQITRHQRGYDGYGDYDMTTYVPCRRPEGHEGECQNARPVMGWPDFQTISQLVAEVERLRSINDDYLLEMGRQHALLREQKRGENAERTAVVAWLREYAEWLHPGARIAEEIADAIERGEHRKEK